MSPEQNHNKSELKLFDPGPGVQSDTEPVTRPIPDFPLNSVGNSASQIAHRQKAEDIREGFGKQGMNEAVADLGQEAVRSAAVASVKRAKQEAKSAKGAKRGRGYYPRRDPDYGAEPWEEQ